MRRRRLRPAFTLLELLILIGVVGLLISLAVPALSGVRSSAARAGEMAAGRQLMLGYLAYAQDENGRLMPGYLPAGGLKAKDENGLDLNTIAGPIAGRYPWRLAPYLDYNLGGLYLDANVLRAMEHDDNRHYVISLYPSMGLNATFLGGDGSSEGLAFNTLNEQIFGTFYLTRLGQAKRPTSLIVFASARSSDVIAPGLRPGIEGNHIVRPPYLRQRIWEARFEADEPAANFGNVSPRHRSTAAIAFLDGHTGALNTEQLQDMRQWADQADRPDWTLKPQS